MYQRPIPLPTASSMMQRSRADSTTMRAETVRAAAVFLVSFCFYAFTRAQTMAHSRDAIEYMNMIDRNDLYHPHHLLYNWLGSLWVRGFGAVGISADSITLVQLMDAIFGAAFVLVFYAMLRYRVGLGPSSGIVGASLPGLSYGVWAYSTTVEVYVPPLALLWAALFVLSTRRRTARNISHCRGAARHGGALAPGERSVRRRVYHLLLVGLACVATDVVSQCRGVFRRCRTTRHRALLDRRFRCPETCLLGRVRCLAHGLCPEI